MKYKLSHNFSDLQSERYYTMFSVSSPLPGIENHLIVIHFFFLLSCILIICM